MLLTPGSARAPSAPFRSAPLRGLRRLLLRLHLGALRRPVPTLLALLALVLALATQVPRLHVLISLESLAERGLRATETNRRMRATFHTGNELGVLFAPERPGAALSPGQVQGIHAWLTREAAGNPDVARIVSPFGLRRSSAAGPFPVRLPLVDTGTREEMDALAASPWGGILTDRQGRDLAAQLELRDTPGGSRYGRFDPRVIGGIDDRLRRMFPRGSGVEVHLVGPAAFEYYSLRGIQWFRFLNIGMLLLILVLLRVLLGSWKSGGLMAGILLVTALSVAGGMALAGHPIDLLSTGMFLILAVAALEDFLFLSHLQLRRDAGWRRPFRVMLAPSLLTSLTTVIGFWSLCASDMSIVRRLGLWAGIGAAIEWGVMFLVLPAFVLRFRAWRRWVDPARAWQRGIAEGLVHRSLPRGLAIGLLLVYAAGAYGAFHLNHNDSIPRLFDERNPYREGFHYLERSRGYQGSVDVVLPGADARAANTAVLGRIAALGGVARVLSPYEVLDAGLGVSGMVPSEIEELNPEAMGRLRGFFAPDGHVRAIVYLRDIDAEPLRLTLRAIAAACGPGGGQVAGDLVTYAEFSDRVPATLYRSLGSCLLLVGLLLLGLLWLMRIRGKAIVLAASFWGTAVMMAALWLLRVPLNFLTCIFASVLVGLTGDNVIQYLFASPRGRLATGIRDRGGASIQVSTVMALASLVFVGSAFVPSRRLGALLAAGFLVALAGDLWLLKALWRGREPGTGSSGVAEPGSAAARIP